MSLPADLHAMASLPSPLPQLSEGNIFTKEQWDILFSIMEVVLPSLSEDSGIPASQIDEAVSELLRYLPENATEEAARAYLSDSPTKNPAFREIVHRKLKLFVPPSDIQGLAFVLSTLNTSVGSYLLTGVTGAIHKQTLDTRTSIVCGWESSRLAPLRAAYRSITGLARQCYINSSSSLYQTIGFPTTPVHIDRRDSYKFVFEDFSSSVSANLSTDVIIIGSGCGAGVVASHLSRAGLECTILEKSYHFSSDHYPMSSTQGGEHLAENGGSILSDDGSTIVLAGSSFGGGSTINWSASLQPYHAVREEWAKTGLAHFLSDEFQDCLDTVCQRIGASGSNDLSGLAKVPHNFANAVLLEGSRRLGMDVRVVPQNARPEHYCSAYCTWGCPSAAKQGSANCWFPDAASHGARFIEGCFVEEVTFTPAKGKKVATGVKATWTSRDRLISRPLTISAKHVVVAGGSLHSPGVLLRSGLSNPQIGANLQLHPTCMVWGTWAQRINPWEGAILTTAVTALDDLDGKHHGPKIEAMCSVPGYGLLSLPFRAGISNNGKTNRLASALDYRLNAAKHGHSAGFICITRDVETGRVYMDPTDSTRRRVRIAYTTGAIDRKHILQGILAAARIQFVMGAREIDTCNPHSVRWVRPTSLDSTKTSEDDGKDFARWLAGIETLGVQSPEPITIGSAHQMSTCRMSATSKGGVVDSKGRVWGTEGLYVADASVLPSASGVNPMVTTMGIAEWIARGIVKDVRAQKLPARL